MNNNYMNSNNLMNGEMVKNMEIEQPIFKNDKKAITQKTAKVFGKAIINEQAIARLVSRRKKAIAKKKVDSILKSLSENMIILLKILGMVEDINKQSKKKEKRRLILLT